MGISTSTGTLTAGQSRTFNLAPASAVTLTLSPNVRVTITETPATVAATGLGGNASRVHEPRLPGTFTYGPYPMGGTVVVDVESNSGSSVAWVRSDSIVAEIADGAVSLVDGAGNPVSIPISILQCGVPVGIAPTGTMGANGGVTLGTAFNATYDGGLWLYFPSGGVYAGSASGFYWTVMSSTTLGTVYDNTYTPGTTSFDIPASPTAISAAGPGAYTGFIGNLTAHSITLPGGSLGTHGSLLIDFISTNNSSGNGKGCRAKLGEVYFGGANNWTTTIYTRALSRVSNAGRPDKQRGASWFFVGQAATYSSASSSQDTTIDQTLAVLVNSNTAGTDYSICESVLLQVCPS